MKPSISSRFILFLSACIMTGLFLGWMDTSPNWDDTGITVMAIVICAFAFGLLAPRHAWLWALIIGGSVTAFNLIPAGNFGAALSLAFAFAGSYAGMLLKKLVMKVG